MKMKHQEGDQLAKERLNCQSRQGNTSTLDHLHTQREWTGSHLSSLSSTCRKECGKCHSLEHDALLITKRNDPDHDGGKYESNGAEKIPEIGGHEAGTWRCLGKFGQIQDNLIPNFF